MTRDRPHAVHGPRLQLRWQVCNWVEQFDWQACGFEVVPTVVIEGRTVVPADVLMQVLWQAWTCEPQANRHVWLEALGGGKMLGVGAVIA